MKCLLVNLYDKEIDDSSFSGEGYIKTMAAVTVFRSKKNLLKYLQKNISYYKGGKRPNFKSLKKYLNEWNHCMWLFPYRYLKYIIEYFKISKNDIHMKEIGK